MVKYLVDTDVLIEYLKGKQEIVNLLQSLGKSVLAVSVITVAEILEGVIEDPYHRQQLEGLFESVEILNINPSIAFVFAKERADLRKSGNFIDNMDLFIAATAIQSKRTLITGNKKDFARVKSLKIH